MLLKKQIRLTSRLQAGSLVGAFALLALLTACGGDDGGGAPASPPSGTTVSGVVQAPNGQLAFNKPPGVLERVISLFIPTVHASISGLSAVPDGTAVQLARFNAMGTSITTLATTSTKEGRYTFNLTNLGISFANDLIVQASGPTGTILRAFVTNPTVDVDPASELAVRLVLEQIAATPGGSFSHFTVKEVNDIAASMKLLTTAKTFTGGANLEATITTIRNAVTTDPSLTAFLTAAAEAGQTTLGPGDVGNYFPFAQGNVWTVQGTRTETGQPTISFQNVHTITGTKLIGPITATVFSESNNAGSGTPEDEYLTKETTGIIFRGNNDPTDTISPQFTPYQEVQFPLQVGASFHPVTKSGFDIGQDLDGDGKNETANLTSQVTVIGFETVVVPAGSFANTVQIKIQLTTTVFPSKNGPPVTATETITLWHAPGVGTVKRRSVTQVQGFTATETEELVSHVVNAWVPTSLQSAPDARTEHTVVWTGTELIIWGGQDGNSLTKNTGARLNPLTNRWIPIATTGAPSARFGHTAIWTGREMIVWGGISVVSLFDGLNDGAKYNPETDTWTPISALGQPSARLGHTAIWTGTEMIVWGGVSCLACNNAQLNTGARYDPTTDTWVPTVTAGAPSPRGNHTSVWTGSKMIVWGGDNDTAPGPAVVFNTGGIYNPATNSWSNTTLVDSPPPVRCHSAVWTGTDMIVFGGQTDMHLACGLSSTNVGSRYNPETDTWNPIKAAPLSISSAPTVWSGTQMITCCEDGGARYNPVSDSWNAISRKNIAMVGTHGHTLVWTGAHMIVWGGQTGIVTNTGGIYDPSADSIP